MVRDRGADAPTGKPGTKSGSLAESAAVLRAGLMDAEAALAAGDMALAERQAKAVSALVRAARDVAELEALVREQEPEQDDEALRAEIRSRIARFVEAAAAGDSDEALERLARDTFSE